MDLITYSLDILKLIVAGLVIFFAGWFVVRSYLDMRFQVEMMELKREHLKHSLPLRLQAYERMALFIERLNPSQLFVRLQAAGMSASELQNVVLTEVRAEYQHNISQQLYVSEPAWMVVRKLRDETIAMINQAMKTLPEGAAAIELSRLILKHMASIEEENPYDEALKMIRNEMQSLF